MQKSTTISDRLRGILTSFIGQDTNSPPSPVCEARDWDSFVERVHSFRSSSWFAKPHWLSPIICARYGWINVDVDVLRCVGCQSVLVVRAPSSFDPAIYSACQKRLEDQLKQAAHHPCCTWPSCPTPEVIILARGNTSNQADVVEDFINKVLLFYSVGVYLPAIDQSPLDVTESDVAALCSLVRSSSKFVHDTDAEIPGALQSAVLLALVGWNLSDGDKALVGCTSVQCSLCMRQPGLWNYISIASSGDQVCIVDNGSGGESQLDHPVNAVEEVADLHTADDQSPCDITDGQLDTIHEIDGMQSTADDINVPTDVEDSLPSVISEKNQVCSVDNGSGGEPQLDHPVNAVEEMADLHTADDQSPCDITDGQLDNIHEIDGMQSSAGDSNVPAAVGDLLPSVTYEKCLDFQKSLASSQSVDAINDTPNMLLGNDNEPC